MRVSTLGSAFLLLAMVGLSASGCSNTSGSSATDGGLTCRLGGGCAETLICPGGVAGCTSNCQCLDGTWQAPCPAALPQTGNACTPSGAGCGYTTSTNACGASNCYCQGGAWNCEPTCVIDASAACVAAGGQCVSGVAFCANVGPGASPGSCLDVGPAMLCCAVNPDAGCTEIQASSYDQTCTRDSDCVAVSVGNACEECVFACGANVGAINAGAMAQYRVDVAKTPAGVAVCGCPEEAVTAPCCRNGQCHADNECVSADGSTDAADAGGSRTGRVPVNHRPSDAQCSMPAPPGDCAGPYPGGGGCASDSDCNEAGTSGRCINTGGGPAAPCFCTYDKCLNDTGCPAGQTCACHGAPYTDSAGNACVKGNCRIDADCGAEGYCSPSSDTSICGDSLAGYYCHTPGDLCVDDSDCPGSAKVAGGPGCVYATTNSRWECLVVSVCL